MSSFTIGLITGLLSSLAVGWGLPRICRPKITISSKIAHMKNKSYVFKIQNKSRLREIYDISIDIRYCSNIKSYYSYQCTNVSLLKCYSKSKIPKIQNEPFELKIRIQSPTLKNNKNKVDLLDFLNADEHNKNLPYIDIVVICYDKLSGSTRHVISQRYTINDVIDGFFQQGEIEPQKYSPDDEGLHI